LARAWHIEINIGGTREVYHNVTSAYRTHVEFKTFEVMSVSTTR
jgi:hypothetical protein